MTSPVGENLHNDPTLFSDHSQFTLNTVARAWKNVYTETQRVTEKSPAV